MNSRGQSVIEALISLTVLAAVLAALLMTADHFAHQTQELDWRLAANDQQSLISGLLSSVELCTCQLSRDLNPLAAPVLVVDTTTTAATTVQRIDLGKFRSTCDHSSTTNIVVEKGANTRVGNVLLRVNDVLINDIRFSGRPDEYIGRIEVALQRPDNRGLPSLKAQVRFRVDSTSGTPEARPIQQCIGLNETLPGYLTCPPGYRMLGAPGLTATECISETTKPSATIIAASRICHAEVYPGFAQGRLCHSTTWTAACAAGIFHPSVAQEFLGSSFAIDNSLTLRVRTLSPSDCNGIPVIHSIGTARPFRCCL